jgi:hypothetical protein
MISDEEAKAAQELAKLGQKSVDVVSGAGGFLARIFGPAIAQLSEALADKAAAYRVVNRAKVVGKTREQLKKLGVTDFKAIDPRNGLPLLEAISDEPDDTLQDVWAAYIANALDPARPEITPNRQLINIIRQLEPEDLGILSGFSSQELAESRTDPLRKIVVTSGDGEAALNRSLSRLTALGLFSFKNGPGHLLLEGSAMQPCRVLIGTSLGEFTAMPLLLLFKNAIDEPGTK